jgi:hypothetical protein
LREADQRSRRRGEDAAVTDRRGDRLDYGVELIVGHAGEQRQRDGALTLRVRQRELRGAVAVDREPMDGRIVQVRLDATLVEHVAERVPVQPLIERTTNR